MAYIESIIIKDSVGTEADVTAANALKVDGSSVTQPVNIVGGSLSANVSIQTDAFQQTVISTRYNQVEINFSTDDPDSITELTVTKSNGGDASNATGQALFTSGANTNGGVSAVTNTSVVYRPHAETYCAFTAIWTSGGLANSYQRIGIYDANNGFFIGYEGTVFGVTIRKGGADTQTAQAAFNVDDLTGGVTSKYTRNGVPEAANFALDNLFRIRFGWLGAAPIQFEIFSPDGEWVLFHIIRHPNTVALPSVNDPNLPITLDIKKTAAGATVLDMNTACWAAGTSSDLSKVTDTITDNTLASLNRSVIAGRSSTGGGTYYNVKVTPSGAMVTAGSEVYAEDSAHASGADGAFILAVRNDANAVVTSTDGDYSQISVNDKGAVAIQDGGNSITVDGTVNAQTSYSHKADDPYPGLAEGAFVLAVRNDNAATDMTDTDGDYSAMAVDRKGQVYVNQATGNIFNVRSNTEYAEDDVHNTGDRGNFILAVRNDNATTVFTDANGDYNPIAVDRSGEVFIKTATTTALNIALPDEGQQTMANSISVAIASDQSAVPIADGGGSITVDGTVAATKSGTWTLDANSGVDIGDVTINNAAGASAVNIQDGGNSITVDGTVTATLPANSGVDIGDVTINNAAGASAVNIQDGGNSITVDGTVSATAAGDVAHDSPDSGNPVKIGFQAETVLPAAVTNGDRVNGTADQFGRQLITHISPGMQTWKSANYTTSQTGAAIWTPGAGKTIAITYLAVSSYATTTGRVIIWFGAAGDTTYSAGTDQLVWAGSFAPTASSKPGAIISLPNSIFSATADYILRITTDANISLDITVYGYEF